MTLLALCNESHPKLLETPRIQILWLTSNLVQVASIHVDSLIISLLRQIISSNFSESNLWLCAELVKILSGNWDWMLDEPLVLTSVLFVYLRLLVDHYRLEDGMKLDSLKRMEIDFCIKALRECSSLCLEIVRELIRLLQDLVHIPEFRDVWMDLLFDPKKFQVLGFTDISVLY